MDTPAADFATVKRIIEGCFVGNTFTLADDALGPGEIQLLIDAYFPDDQLVLTQASYTNWPDYILVSGVGVNQPLGSTNVNVAFAFDSALGGATMNLLATPQAGWTFGVSFPKLGTTFLPELGFEFDADTDHPCGFYLASYDSITTQTQYGLYFRGHLQLTGLLAQLNWLLGGAETLQVQGPVNMHQGIPEMDLAAPLVAGAIPLGYLTIPGVNFDITSQLVPSQDGGVQSESASALMSFSTAIRFQSSNTRVDIPVSAAFINRPTFLQFSANLSDALYATLEELAVLVAGADLESLLGGLNLSDYVGLSDFTLQVNPSTRELMSVSMGVRTTQPLTLIANGGYGNVITVNQIELSFRILPPYTSPSLGMAVFGEVQIFDSARLEISALYPDFTFDAQLQEGTNLNLVQVVEYFVQSISPDALADVPAINVTEFELTVQPSANYYFGKVLVENDWPITLGPTTLLITDVLFQITYDNGDVSAIIGGVLIIGDNLAIITAHWELPGDLLIQGVIPEIDLTALVNTYVSTPFDFTLPPLTLTNTTLLIERFQDGGYLLAFGTSVTAPNFGTLELEFGETNAQTGVTVGFMLPPNWKLTELSSDFDVWLLRDLTFTAASLVISSFNNPYFRFRSSQNQPLLPQYASSGVQEGMYLYADLTLDPNANNAFGSVSKFLAGGKAGQPSGLTSLKVALSVPSTYRDTEFTATLTGGFTFIESGGNPIVVLDDLAMIVRPFQEYIDLEMDVSIYIKGVHLGLNGAVIVNGPEVDLRLETTTPWINPFNIQGLTLNNLAAEFRFGDTIALGLEGEVTIGTGTTAVVLVAAMEFNIEAEFLPDVFFVSASGTINFGAIIGSFVANKYIPSVLNSISIYQFTFIVVANPAGWTDLLTGQRYGAGIGFSGTVAVYGLIAQFVVQVDYVNGITATGQLNAPLTLGPVHNGVPAVTIANASHWDQGPYISISSAHSPYVNMSVALRIWEISTIQLSATISNNAFMLSFNFTLGSVSNFGQMAITAYIQNGSAFQFNAALAISVSDVGPIKVGSKNLGTIHPQFNLAAAFGLSIGPGLHLGLSIQATFALSGYRMTLPSTSLSVSSTSLTSFSQIYDLFKQTLAQVLWDIGAVLFQDANALFRFVSDRFMRLTNDIGNIMKNYLRLGLNDAAVYLKSVADVMTYDVDDVALLLKSGFNTVDKDLAIALKYANYAVEDVAQVISNLYHKASEEVAQILKDAGYELGEIATALKKAFGYSAKEVAKFFKSAWNIVDTLVNSALAAAEYDASLIKDAMKDVYGWFKSVVKTAAHYLNPTNW